MLDQYPWSEDESDPEATQPLPRSLVWPGQRAWWRVRSNVVAALVTIAVVVEAGVGFLGFYLAMRGVVATSWHRVTMGLWLEALSAVLLLLTWIIILYKRD